MLHALKSLIPCYLHQVPAPGDAQADCAQVLGGDARQQVVPDHAMDDGGCGAGDLLRQ